MSLTGKSMFMAKKGSSYETEKEERKKKDLVLNEDGVLQDRKTYHKENLAKLMALNEIKHREAVAREAAEEEARRNPPAPPAPPVEPPTPPVEPPAPPVEPNGNPV